MAVQTDKGTGRVHAEIEIDPLQFDKLMMMIYMLTELGEWRPEKNPFHSLAGAVVLSVEQGKICLIQDLKPEGDDA